MILGSEALAPMVRSLLPKAEIITRPRFSTLSYAGPAKLSRSLRARRSSPSPPTRSMRWPRRCAGCAAARRW
jgi:hypothetical protein